MPHFIIKKLPYDLTSNAGLALVGQYIKHLEIGKPFDRQFQPFQGAISIQINDLRCQALFDK